MDLLVPVSYHHHHHHHRYFIITLKLHIDLVNEKTLREVTIIQSVYHNPPLLHYHRCHHRHPRRPPNQRLK
jgi:hypothetical protein